MKIELPTGFPSAPEGKEGWPWTPAALEVGKSADCEWPKITVVTPSYNYGSFIEETIRSVLLQGYPNLEYFVIDGGSTDGTVEIIKRYEPWLSGWVSEKDGGQADAINKGWARATGDIVAWINSDDWYLAGALHHTAREFKKNPECLWLAGTVVDSLNPSEPLKHQVPGETSVVHCLGRHRYYLHQPGMFWGRNFLERVGTLDADLHYTFDHEWWVRAMVRGIYPSFTAVPLAGFRRHIDSKTGSHIAHFHQEEYLVLKRFLKDVGETEYAEARCLLDKAHAALYAEAVFGLLARGRRTAAISYLMQNLRLLGQVRPRKLQLAILYRTLLVGKPPKWFLQRYCK